MSSRVIRWSEIKAFKRCRRKWLNGYIADGGWQTPEFTGEVKPGKKDVGTLVHKDLEAYYNGDTEAPGLFLPSLSVPQGTYEENWKDTYLLAQIMLDGYAEWLEDEGYDHGEETWGTEVEVDVPLDSGVVLQCHVDRIVYNKTWDRWIIEDTKTVDSLAKDESFAVDEQMLTYTWAVREALGLPITECRHNMLRRVKRTARATPPFYARVPMNPSDSQVEAARRHAHDTVADMLRCEREGTFYPNPTRDCSWDCDFLPICAMHDDGHNQDLTPIRETLYIRRKDQQNAAQHRSL